MRFVSGLFLAGACCALLGAGPDDPPGRRPFTMVGTDQGLSTGAVITMAQDTDGFLWMGTENGLLRYEGGQSRQWGAEDGLPSSSVPELQAAPGGGIWAGTLRGLGLFRNGRFQPVTLAGVQATGSAGNLTLDRQGRLWAMLHDGLVRQRSGLDFERVDRQPPGGVYALEAGHRTGNVYCSGPFGIQVYQEDGTVLDWGPAQGLPPDGPVFALEDGQGRVWAGSGRTLVLKVPGDTRFRDASAQLSASLSPNGKPYLDRDGSVWLPTQDGAQQLDGERLDAARGLPFRWVRKVFRDREGTLWVMGPGLAHLLGGGRVANHSLSREDSGEVVWSMVRDAKGRMLSGTDNGVVRLEPGGPVRIPGTTGWRIKGMVLDRTGTLWMVNTRGPTLWLKAGQTQAQVAPLGAAGVDVNSVFEDSRGRVWLGGTHQGLLRWDPAAGRLVQEVAPAFCHARVLGCYEIHEDTQSRVWVGTDTGLLVQDAAGAWTLFSDAAGTRNGQRVRGMALLPDGTAWVHNEEPFGLAHVKLAEGRLQVLERRNRGWGLCSNMVYGVRRDALGHLWVATDKGLDRVDPYLHVGAHDGLASEDCSISALLLETSPGGEPIVWVGTAAGLVRFDATVGGALPAPPQAWIMQVGYGERSLEPPLPLLGALPYDQATLDIRVAAPSYANDRDLRFQVRLVGLEERWRTLEGRKVHFPSLPAGSYRFEVRAALPQGGFGPSAALAFRVKPPWWRTGWTYLLTGLSATLVLAGLVRMRLASLARSKALLEALVAARTRELSQRNAELSEALGSVKQLSGLIPICAHCRKVRDDQGYWNQLEAYLAKHAGAGFSHGICPECTKDLFPEFLPKENG